MPSEYNKDNSHFGEGMSIIIIAPLLGIYILAVMGSALTIFNWIFD